MHFYGIPWFLALFLLFMSSFTWVLRQHTQILRLAREAYHLLNFLLIRWTILIPSETLLHQQQKAKTNEPILQIFVYLQWLLFLTETRNWNIIHCLFSWLTNCNIISSADKICEQVVKQPSWFHKGSQSI